MSSTPTPLEQARNLLWLLDRRRQTHKLEYYKPYHFQAKFHNALGHRTDAPAVQKVLMAGNQVGKTFSAAMETAIHATGKYPDWWTGYRFSKPIQIMVGGMTNESVRDICQKELFGDPNDPAKLGTGTVPISLIGKRTSKPGVPNALDTAMVKHVSGGQSKIMFRAYEQGAKKHMGIRLDLGWLDEEPPLDIWSQYLRATIATRGILYMTFTPEQGMTELVMSFLNDLKPGQAIVNATWDDAPHIVGERKEQILSAIPPHERDMRSKGIPMMGSGLVFPFREEQFVVDPIEIPRHWPQIIGIDFGFDHPFGAAKLAWDRDSDTVYVVADYREERATPAIHAAAIKPWGDWPVSWPHDGLNTEKGTGKQMRQFYVEEGLQLLRERATNPPQNGQVEGEGGNSLEASILAMYERLETGRLKVFKTCRHVLEEMRIYHRKDGRIVALRDDTLSAVRYAHMMLRHARTEAVKRKKRAYLAGATNW